VDCDSAKQALADLLERLQQRAAAEVAECEMSTRKFVSCLWQVLMHTQGPESEKVALGREETITRIPVVHLQDIRACLVVGTVALLLSNLRITVRGVSNMQPMLPWLEVEWNYHVT
jgi:hypothetical protein